MVDLLLPALAIFIAGLLSLLFVEKRRPVLLIIPFSRAILFIVFFLFYQVEITGEFRSLRTDDYHYLNAAEALIQLSNWPLLFLKSLFVVQPEVLEYTTGHFVYEFYNLLSILMFGDYYFSPVALNICVSFFTAALFAVLLSKHLPQVASPSFIYSYYTLHWDVLTWISFLNLKESLVHFLIVCCMLSLSDRLILSFKARALLFVVTSIILFRLRFYIVPVVVLAVLLCPSFISKSGKKTGSKQYFFVGGLFLITLVLMHALLPAAFPHVISLLVGVGIDNLYQCIHFLVSPIPFNTSSTTLFTWFSSWLHWLFLPFTFIGFIICVRSKNSFLRVVTLWFLITTLCFSLLSVAVGPRQRFQLNLHLQIFQIMGMAWLRAPRSRESFHGECHHENPGDFNQGI